ARSSSRKASSLGLRVRSIWSLLPRWSASYRRSALLRLDALDQGACPEPAPATHRYEPDLLVGSLELVQKRCDEPGAGRAERMAERDRAPVNVDAIHIGLELASPGSHDGGEGLVDLDQVDVAQRHLVSLEELLRRRNRPGEHDHGVDADRGLVHDPCTR